MTTPGFDELTSIRALEMAGEDRHSLARAAARGEAHRVRRGFYVPAASWRSADSRHQYVLRCIAESDAKRTRPILSHWSAAAVHGVPIVGEWPQSIHRLVERSSGGRSRRNVAAHPTRLDAAEIVEIDGMLVTSIARTVVDLAAASSRLCAVTAADYALHRKRSAHLLKGQLYSAFEAAKPLKSFAKIEWVLRFCTHMSDSPAESVSRVNMFAGGFVMPVLQTAYADAAGFIGEADFDWPNLNHLGEVDGRQKYLKPEYLNGRSPGEVVYEEKLREGRLRALPKKVTRWGWHQAVDPARLRATLLAAGIPLRRR